MESLLKNSVILFLELVADKEDLSNDFYYEYFKQNGERIIPGYTVDQIRTDSTRYEPVLYRDQYYHFYVFPRPNAR